MVAMQPTNRHTNMTHVKIVAKRLKEIFAFITDEIDMPKLLIYHKILKFSETKL